MVIDDPISCATNALIQSDISSVIEAGNSGGAAGTSPRNANGRVTYFVGLSPKSSIRGHGSVVELGAKPFN